MRTLLAQLLAGCMLILSIPALSQVQFKVELLPDEVTYRVAMLPSVTLIQPSNITGTGQVTLTVATGGFEVANIVSPNPGVTWTQNGRDNAPLENPGFDYITFGLTTPGTSGLSYQAGLETTLFTFTNSGICTGAVELMDNENDPFFPNPTNSAGSNPGNQLSTLGAGPDTYQGNFAQGSAQCPGADDCAVFFDLELLPNNCYQVSLISQQTLINPQNVTSTLQVTVKVPTGGFLVGGIQSLVGGAEFGATSKFIAPTEDPNFDYWTINLLTQGTDGIEYIQGDTFPLFIFKNTGVCTGSSISLMDNFTDPFFPPNSQNANVGQQLSNVGFGQDAVVCVDGSLIDCVNPDCQVEFNLNLLPNNCYQVSLVSQQTLINPENITSTLQVTLRVPTGGFNIGNLQSLVGGVEFAATSKFISPDENPDFDYWTINLQTNGTDSIEYIQGDTFPLFTFKNMGLCTESNIFLMDNTTDPFFPPNSQNANVGQQLSNVGFGQDAIICVGNVSAPCVEAPCQIEYNLDLLANGCYQVSLNPQITLDAPQNTVSTLLVTLVAPTGSLEIGDLQNVNPTVEFDFTSRFNSPDENPDFDYLTIALTSLGTPDIPIQLLQSVPLFTFKNFGNCTGDSLFLMNNNLDPFLPPNSQDANVGQQITILGTNGEAVVCTGNDAALLIGNFNIDTLLVTDAICGGAGGSITIVTSGNTQDLQYSIDGGMTFSFDSSFADLTPGTYNIVVRDTLTMCSLNFDGNPVFIGTGDNDFATVTPASAIICFEDNIQLLAAGGVSFQWSPATGLSDPNIANPIASPTSTTSYIVTITDQFGCVDTASTTIFVDETAPVLIGVPNDTTITCDAMIPDTAVVTAMDDINGIVAVSFSETNLAGDCDQEFTIQRTWTAVDSCGNSVSASQLIAVIDTVPPVLQNIPLDIAVECDAIPNVPEDITAIDNCDDMVVVEFSETETPGNCSQAKTIVRTWTATDDCGNSTSASQTISVSDTSPPTIQNTPSDVSIECDEPLPTDLPTAIDNCDDDVMVTFSDTETPGDCPEEKIITRTFTATDDCGNTSTATQTITVEDNTAPELSGVPADITVMCNQVPPPAQVTASDNCDDNVPVTLSETQTGMDCPFTLIRTWSATDNCGNMVQAAQVITVLAQVGDCSTDTIPPMLVGVPMDTTIECSQPFPDTPMVTAMDNFDSNPIVMFSEEIILGDCENEFFINRTWVALDSCGNTSQASQIISIVDTTAPVITVFEPFLDGVMNGDTLMIPCDSFPILNTGAASASDNCDDQPSLEFVEFFYPGDCVEDGFTMLMCCGWQAEDNCGNVSTHLIYFKLIDTIPPVFTSVPEDMTVDCQNIPLIEPSVDDNCDEFVELSFEEVISDGDCPFTITRTWTATDDCGNQNSVSQIITVNDTLAPVVLNVPMDITVECGNIPDTVAVKVVDNCDLEVDLVFEEMVMLDTCPGMIIRKWTATDDCGNSFTATQKITIIDSIPPVLIGIPEDITVSCEDIPNPPTVTATDNCDEVLEVTFFEEMRTDSCPYQLIRTWSVTDNCGNTNTASQSIFVNDTIAPVFVGMIENITLECGDTIPAVNSMVVDNCDDDVEIIFEDSTEGDSCQMLITRTWTATDACGNTATQTQIITINDTTPPSLIGVPQNTIVECDSIPELAMVTAEDICDPDVTVAFTEMMTGDSCNQTITRIWMATDRCGNTMEASQVITVIDSEAPVLIGVPEDLMVDCDSIPDAPIVTAMDNCDADVPVSFEESMSGDDCQKIITRTWTATDDCGNTTSATQTITIQDTIPPTIIPKHPALAGFMSGDTLVMECDSPFLISPDSVMVMDNCDDDVEIEFGDYLMKHGDCDEDGYLIFMWCGWTATDDCGNTTVFDFYVKIIDSTPPEFHNVAEDITIECDEQVPDSPLPNAWDNCSDTIIIEALPDSLIAGDCPQEMMILRQWKATDECGNMAFATQKITIVDTTAPLLTIPADTLLNPGDSIPSPAVVFAIDNCDTLVDITLQQDTIDVDCGFEIQRTWTATDDCGNETSQTQRITVIENLEFEIDTIIAEFCGGMDGTVILSPTNFDYQWSDGGTGFERNDLAAGTYTVTATNGNGCIGELTFEVGAECFCIDFEVDSLQITDADCELNNGMASIFVTGDESDYTYTWVPDRGTPNAAGNTRKDLPPGQYLVLVEFMDIDSCNEKVTIVIEDDCDSTSNNLIQEENDAVSINCEYEQTSYCLDIPYVDFVQYGLLVNGTPYEGDAEACNVQTQVHYSFGFINSLGLQGTFSIQDWQVNGASHSGQFQSMDELMSLLNQWDPNAQWQLDQTTLDIYSNHNNGDYGSLYITHQLSGAIEVLAASHRQIPMGTSLSLPAGHHELVLLQNTGEALDTVTVAIACVTPDIIEDVLTVGEERVYCLSTDELMGAAMYISDMHEWAGGEIAASESFPHCISFNALLPGYGESMLVLCDDYGICDTTYLFLNVQPRAEDQPLAINDTIYIAKEEVKRFGILDNDYLPYEVEVSILEQSANGTLHLLEDNTIAVQSNDNFCNDLEPLLFTYEIKDEYMRDTATVMVYVLCHGMKVYSGFSPNGDGINDHLVIEGLEAYPNNHLLVFNRWGNKVLDQKNYQNDWKGTNGSDDLPDGTYFYLLDDGEGNKHSGYVQIRR